MDENMQLNVFEGKYRIELSDASVEQIGAGVKFLIGVVLSQIEKDTAADKATAEFGKMAAMETRLHELEERLTTPTRMSVPPEPPSNCAPPEPPEPRTPFEPKPKSPRWPVSPASPGVPL